MEKSKIEVLKEAGIKVNVYCVRSDIYTLFKQTTS